MAVVFKRRWAPVPVGFVLADHLNSRHALVAQGMLDGPAKRFWWSLDGTSGANTLLPTQDWPPWNNVMIQDGPTGGWTNLGCYGPVSSAAGSGQANAGEYFWQTAGDISLGYHLIIYSGGLDANSQVQGKGLGRRFFAFEFNGPST